MKTFSKSMKNGLNGYMDFPASGFQGKAVLQKTL
jgi:hypothetical protein